MDARWEGSDVRVVVGGWLKSGEVRDDGVEAGSPCCRGGVVEGREMVCIEISWDFVSLRNWYGKPYENEITLGGGGKGQALACPCGEGGSRLGLLCLRCDWLNVAGYGYDVLTGWDGRWTALYEQVVGGTQGLREVRNCRKALGVDRGEAECRTPDMEL